MTTTRTAQDASINYVTIGKGDRTMTQQTATNSFRDRVNSGMTINDQLIENAYDLLDEMKGGDTIEFTFEKFYDGSYSVHARNTVTAHIRSIGTVARNEETKWWEITQGATLDSDANSFPKRDKAAAALWRQLRNDWLKAVRSGERTTEGAVAYRLAIEEERFGWMIDSMEREIASSRAKIVKFAQELIDGNRDPVMVFQWCTSETEAAAKITAFNRALKNLMVPIDEPMRDRVARCREYAMDQVFHGGHSPCRSTSPMANLMAQQETAAWAHVVDMITEYFGK